MESYVTTAPQRITHGRLARSNMRVFKDLVNAACEPAQTTTAAVDIDEAVEFAVTPFRKFVIVVTAGYVLLVIEILAAAFLLSVR